ncbi:uncharacterized protein [Prorops nasuta]|uniref:uncharacterized protein n=1 Tax=Prorops nasuta TaxID=863751 RepID=UPI0034CFB97E
MDFPQDPYYALNFKLLSLVGQGLSGNESLNKFRRAFVIFTLLSSLWAQSSAVIREGFAKEAIIDIMPPLTAIAVELIMAIILYRKEDKINYLWRKIKEDWAGERVDEETRIKESYAEIGKFLTTFMTVGLVALLPLFIVLSTFLPSFLDLVAPKDQPHARQMPFLVYYILDNQEHFYYVMLIIHSSLIVCFVFGIANQAMFCVHFIHSLGMFAVLGYRLQHAIPSTFAKPRDESKSINDMCYDSIASCITFHRKSIEFVDTLQNVYAPCFALSLASSILLLSPTLVMFKNLRVIQFNQLFSKCCS